MSPRPTIRNQPRRVPPPTVTPQRRAGTSPPSTRNRSWATNYAGRSRSTSTAARSPTRRTRLGPPRRHQPHGRRPHRPTAPTASPGFPSTPRKRSTHWRWSNSYANPTPLHPSTCSTTSTGYPPEANTWEFYQHSGHWQNRLIHGDSSEVMQSLISRDGLAGRVQMVYFDPPYGISFRVQLHDRHQPATNQEQHPQREYPSVTPPPYVPTATPTATVSTPTSTASTNDSSWPANSSQTQEASSYRSATTTSTSSASSATKYSAPTTACPPSPTSH